MTTDLDTTWTGPLPEVSGETKPFWDACAGNRFLIQRCDDCGKMQYPYRGICCHCWSSAVSDVVIAGTGVVWTYSVVHRNRSKGHIDTGPYVVGVVEIDEGPLVVTNVVGCSPETVAIGMPVQLAFIKTAVGAKIPVFHPIV